MIILKKLSFSCLFHCITNPAKQKRFEKERLAPSIRSSYHVHIFFTVLPYFRYKFRKRFLYNEVGPAEMLVRSLSIINFGMRARARKTAAARSIFAGRFQITAGFPQFAYYQEERQWTHRPDWKFRI